jgi:transposase
METVTTRNQVPVVQPALYMAIETGGRNWKVGFSSGLGQRPRIRGMQAGDLGRLCEEIRAAKRRFGLAEEVPVYSCYEAGRDGFWLHRALEKMEIVNRVLDSSSLPVDRRARRAKSDGLDVAGLLILVIRICRGEDRVCRVCRPPSPEAEDLRQLSRELESARWERTASINRIKSLLATQGVLLHHRGLDEKDLVGVQIWDGTPLPARLRARIEREQERLRLLDRQIHALEVERRDAMRKDDDRAAEIAMKLQRLRAIGPGTGWVLAVELFAWRCFRNVRQLAAVVGLVPTPYQSGAMHHELGISKAGNRHVRWIMVQLAWRWVQMQPQSALTLWFNRKYDSANSVQRCKGIVAVARKLLIALWKYVEHDELPEGALLKP